MKTKLLLGLLTLTILISHSCDKVGQPKITLGDVYQGGTVFYLFDEDDPGYVKGEYHGLIVTNSDHGSAPWSFNFHPIGTSEGIGQGATNTNSIVSYIGNGFYAAKICDQLVHCDYDDWYLPSKNELNKLYEHREHIENLAGENQYYQSSTEYDNKNMWIQDMHGSGPISQGNGSKTVPFLIRPIRTF